MAWAPNLVGLVSLGVAVIGWALASFVYKARPRRAQNQLLAIMLALDGFRIAGGTGVIYLSNDPRIVYACQFVNTAAVAALTVVTLVFLGTLLPLGRRLLGRPPAVPGVLALGFAVIVAELMLGRRVVAGVVDVDYAPLDGVLGPVGNMMERALLGIALLSFAVGIAAWRWARPGTAARAQAASYALAFGVRDSLNVLLLAIGARDTNSFSDLEGTLYYLGYPAMYLLFFLLLAYGILHSQLFDIQLKIRWTIKRGTLAGIFIAVFLIVSQIAQNYLSTRGGLIVGGVVTGLVLFAINPLQHFAERLSAAAVPGGAPEALEARKLDIFRAALEGALEDGDITDRERSMLTRLQLELGIANGQSKVLEAQVRQAAGGGS